MKTELRTLLKTVRDLIVATPGFRYYPESAGAKCNYNKGGDPDFPLQVGCLFGQALRSCGEEVSKRDEGDALTQLYGGSNVPLILFLQSVQDSQDAGTNWRQSWDFAIRNATPEALRAVKRHVPLKLPE